VASLRARSSAAVKSRQEVPVAGDTLGGLAEAVEAVSGTPSVTPVTVTPVELSPPSPPPPSPSPAVPGASLDDLAVGNSGLSDLATVSIHGGASDTGSADVVEDASGR